MGETRTPCTTLRNKPASCLTARQHLDSLRVRRWLVQTNDKTAFAGGAGESGLPTEIPEGPHPKKSPRTHTQWNGTRTRPPTPDLCAFLRGFAASRETTRLQTSHLLSRSSTDLGLESPSYINSCPFVSIRGSKRTPNIRLQLSVKIRENPCQSVAMASLP